ncbi:MAG: hypothetical protein U9Q76_03220, partial [candidate division WOR-3 bacterium]|nr:hypothetical protein [candidate division WOR-3 bacterium]
SRYFCNSRIRCLLDLFDRYPNDAFPDVKQNQPFIPPPVSEYLVILFSLIMSKTLLVIAAIAVMLAAATSASAYYERWEGWFNSGHLTYGGYTYNYAYGEGIVEDYTSGDIDTFAIHAIPVLGFTCLENGGTIVLRVITSTGWKPTGQEGQKEGRGNWTGTAVLTITGLPDMDFTLEGTWDTGTPIDDMYFDYTDYPEEDATYSAKWRVSNSTPLGLDGEGGSAGELME